MRQSKAAIVVTAILVAAVSFPVFARGHSGGGRSHASPGARGAVAHVAPSRHYAGHAVIGAFVAAPLLIAAPRYYFPPPPRIIAPVPNPAYWYYCPQYNAYYPHVLECPGPWQPVIPQPDY